MKFQLEFHPNPDCLSIHVQKQLTDQMIEMWFDLRHADKDNGIDNPAPAYVKEIMQVEGITGEVSLHRYRIQVHKGKLFSWDELAPKIVTILQGYLDPEGTAEMVEPFIQSTTDHVRETQRASEFHLD